MITILYYLLKVVLCSALLYSYYLIALRNKKFHQYNRFYLMGMSVLCWIVPFLKINIIKEQVISAPKVMHFANVIAENNSTIEQEVVLKSAQFTWDNFLLFIGITISILFIVRFVKSLWHVRKLIKKYPLKKLASLYLVLTDVKGTPFSFFKYIFWNTSIDLNSEIGKKIFAHEVAHVEENHSLDKLLIELQLVIGWFNPIVWLIRNELYLIHEFIADQKSIQNNDSSVLAELLLASAYPTQQHILSNSFFFSPIKRRIQMFTKTNTKFSYLRRLTILPIMAVLVLLFAFRNSNLNSKPIVNLDKQYTVVIDAGHGGEDIGVSAADGSTEKDLVLAIAQNIKSLNNNPNINIVLTRNTDKLITVVDRTNIANAANANLFVSIHMDNDLTKKATGTTCYIPLKNKLYIKESNLIARNILATTSELFPTSKITTRDKGIWVIENVKMPSVLFECGFMTNINDLKLVKDNEEKIAKMILEGISNYFISNEKYVVSLDLAKPKYFVNGVKISEEEMNAIAPDHIKSVNVIKGNQAIQKYHEDGKNGVVEITLKNVESKGQQTSNNSNNNWSNVIGYNKAPGLDNYATTTLVIKNGVKLEFNGSLDTAILRVDSSKNTN
ncbi:MAG: N-acetylmuramoyl-L-alanine amidase, partial [Sediminibacterium sp.]